MINVFVLQSGRLSQVHIEKRLHLEELEPVWVDLTDPDEEERSWVKAIYGVTLPGEDEVKDIEASARYYEAESGDLHLRTDFFTRRGRRGFTCRNGGVYPRTKNLVFCTH